MKRAILAAGAGLVLGLGAPPGVARAEGPMASLQPDPALPDPALRLGDLDALVAADMARFGAPAMAVGVVFQGKVLVEKAYGLRDVARHLPATPHTIFPIGSLTKSFTATLAMMGAARGEVALDTPVRTYLPWFALQDPQASGRVTLRDMLLHRTGLPSHDMLRVIGPWQRRQVLEKLRWLAPNRPYPGPFQYNNLMYVAAGYTLGERAGRPWEDLVRERVIAPLGMADTDTSMAQSLRMADRAIGYMPGDGGGPPRALPPYDYQRYGVGPNGAINSSLDDLLKYMRFQLTGRDAQGQPLLSPEALAEMHRAQIALPAAAAPYGSGYGLGWFVGDYGGHRLVLHTGSIFGYHVYFGFMPDLGYGVVVASNQPAAAATRAIANSITDRMLGLPRVDWVKRLPRTDFAAAAAAMPAAKGRPAHPLAAYAGTYVNRAYGAVRVRAQGDALLVDFPDVPGRAVSLGGNRFATRFMMGGGFPYVAATSFQPGQGRAADSVAMDLAVDGETGVAPVVFRRQP